MGGGGCGLPPRPVAGAQVGGGPYRPAPPGPTNTGARASPRLVFERGGAARPFLRTPNPEESREQRGQRESFGFGESRATARLKYAHVSENVLSVCAI